METLNLNPGQMMLVRAKGVAGGKVQLEFAQMVETSYTATGLTSLLNESDERFSKQKPRFAWETGEKADIQKVFGIDVSALGQGEELEIGQLDPTVNGMPLNIQLIESTEGTDYDYANIETRAKRAGKDGDFILHDGQNIFTTAKIVVGKANHVLLASTERQKTASTAAKAAIKEALGGTTAE